MGNRRIRSELLTRAAAVLGAVHAAADERAVGVAALGDGPESARVVSLAARLERRVDAASVRLAELQSVSGVSDSAVYGLAERAESIAAQAERLRRAMSLASSSPVDGRVWELEASDVMEAPARLGALFDEADLAHTPQALDALRRARALRDELAATHDGTQEPSVCAAHRLADGQRKLSTLLSGVARELLAPQVGMSVADDLDDSQWLVLGGLRRAASAFPHSAQASVAMLPVRGEGVLLGPAALQAWWADACFGRRGRLESEPPGMRTADRPGSITPPRAAPMVTGRARLRRSAHANEVGRSAWHRRRLLARYWLWTLAGWATVLAGLAIPLAGGPKDLLLLTPFGFIILGLARSLDRAPTHAGRRELEGRLARLTQLRSRLSATVLDEDGTTLDALLLTSKRQRSRSGQHVAPAAALTEDASLKAVALRAWRVLEASQAAPERVQRTAAFADRLGRLEGLVEAIERRDQDLAEAADAALRERPAGSHGVGDKEDVRGL